MGYQSCLECGQPSGPAARHKAKLTIPTAGDRVATSALASKMPVEVFFYLVFGNYFYCAPVLSCFVLYFLIVSVVVPVGATGRGKTNKLSRAVSQPSVPWFHLPASPLALFSAVPGPYAFWGLFSKDKDQQGSCSIPFSPSSQIVYALCRSGAALFSRHPFSAGPSNLKASF